MNGKRQIRFLFFGAFETAYLSSRLKDENVL